ncbi:MAG: DUF2252 family protein [Bryobacteraceae bacterium]|nr:DUF2252 family protein [Bryobacteraceae bacterium]
MNIIDATKSYEAWLSKELVLLEGDLHHKHELMAEAVFPFLRATYYRWAQIWVETAGDLAGGLPVLAVGDLHIENFGTWRDEDGRLVWGVNDLDEAAELPFTLDLTRLAVSAILASEHHGLGATRAQIAHALLDGYRSGAEAGGVPFVLEERHAALRTMVRDRLKDPSAFWGKLTALPELKGRKPKTAIRLLMSLLPHGVESLRVVHRVAGLGSLGRRRLTAVGQFEGGFLAREVKQLAPPASWWAKLSDSKAIRYGELLHASARCADPFLRQRENWVGRRLSPSNSRIELDDLPRERDIRRLLNCMGAETANIHLGSASRKRLLKALSEVSPTVFVKTTRALENAVTRDWKEWNAR